MGDGNEFRKQSMSKTKRAQKFIGKVINYGHFGDFPFYVEDVQVLDSKDVRFNRKQNSEKTLAFIGRVLKDPSSKEKISCAAGGRLRFKILKDEEVFEMARNGMNGSIAFIHKSLAHYEELQKLSEKERFKMGLEKHIPLDILQESWSDAGVKKELARLEKLHRECVSDMKKLHSSASVKEVFGL